MISVVIPSYNYGHLIGETINSILNQTYSNLEVIVVDDGSTDQTEQVVIEFKNKDSRVKYYKFDNGGLGLSRNRGLREASGEYVQFLDADDLIEKRKFEIQMRIFQANEQVDVVYSSVRYFRKNPYDENDRLLTYWGPNEEWMPKIAGYGNDILPRALKGNFSHLSSPLFKRTLVDKVGDFDNEISAVADYHFLLRCLIDNAYFYYHDTEDTYSLVRWHATNMSSNVKMMRREEQKMRRKLCEVLVENSEALRCNLNAIKSLGYQIDNSWKAYFLSGGKLDFLKQIAKKAGLEGLLLKVFYK